MGCCANCFDDRILREQIIPTFSQEEGECSYCRSVDQLLIDPSKLRDYFEPLIRIYEEDDNGQSLVEWLKQDWGIFVNPRMDHANSSMLLAEILDDGEVVRKTFSPSDICDAGQLGLWETFRNELMFENRFFPQNELNKDLLRTALTTLVIKPSDVSGVWYRARMQRTGKPYTSDEMGPPPKESATQGRANPAGIPYLYLSSDPVTAVSEIRPHTGEVASVAAFSLPEKVEIVDLRNPRNTVSPFVVIQEEEIARLRGDIAFLVRLGEELTRPVLPHVAAIDYLPSQYLCEFIKSCKYGGVAYKSSVGEGVNLAIFQPMVASIENVDEYYVSKVAVELRG